MKTTLETLALSLVKLGAKASKSNCLNFKVKEVSAKMKEIEIKQNERFLNKQSSPSTFKQDRILVIRKTYEDKLYEIANHLDSTGYSMGEYKRVVLNISKSECIAACKNTTKDYSNSCRWKPTYGDVTLHLNLNELRSIEIICGVITIIDVNQKNKSVKSCTVISSTGSKNTYKLTREKMFLAGDYHSKTKEGAKEGAKRNEEQRKEKERQQKLEVKFKKEFEVKFKKAARLQYCFQDSLNANNCEIGSKAFCLRVGISIENKYRGSYLLKLAQEKSTSSVCFINKMIEAKIEK